MNKRNFDLSRCTSFGIAAFMLGRSYLSAAQPFSYTIIDLTGPAATVTCATGINDTGQVIGWSDETDRRSGVQYPAKHAMLFNVNGTTVSPIDLGAASGGESFATAINNAGQIIGTDSDVGSVLYNVNGTVVNRTILGLKFSAVGINNAGQIVGSMMTDDRYPASHAALLSIDGTNVTGIDLDPNGLYSVASGINDAGQIVGTQYKEINNDRKYHAALFHVNGTSPTDLGFVTGDSSAAFAINDLGQVAGYSGNNVFAYDFDNTQTNSHATLFELNGPSITRKDLGTSGGTDSKAVAINNASDIVTYSTTRGSGVAHSTLHTNSAASLDLNSVIGAKYNTSHVQVAGINNEGQIAVTATINGQAHALLLTPIKPSGTPLVFIPGIAGSVLKGDIGSISHHQLWPAVFPWDIGWLKVGGSATNVKAVDIVKTIKITQDDLQAGADAATALGYPLAQGALAAYRQQHGMDDIVLSKIYESFAMHLITTGYREYELQGDPSRMTTNFAIDSSSDLPTFFPYPYDWRLKNDSHMDELHQYIQNIRKLHNDSKVNLVAHSMGGLIARAYVLRYPEDVNLVATVGTPFWGAPVAIYRMLQGDFFDIEGLDTLDNGIVTQTLPTFPSFHELLPSDHFLNYPQSTPVMAEDHFDYNLDGSDTGAYSPGEFKAAIDFAARPNTPSIANFDFHNRLNGQLNDRQDDWSADSLGVSYLHICGQQTVDRTVTQVVAQSETRFGWTGYPVEVRKFIKRVGAGDGVVPLLSSLRDTKFLAPNTQLRVVHDVDAVPGLRLGQFGAEHTEMMANTTVFSMIHSFFAGDPVPTDAVNSPALAAATSTSTISTRHIVINGSNYVPMANGDGNTNAKLTDFVVQKIPGVEVHYGDSDSPGMDMNVDGSVNLNLNGSSSDEAIEIEVIQNDSNGTAQSLRRYRFKPSGNAWQLRIPPANTSTADDLIVGVDSNQNGSIDAGEEIAPSHSSGTDSVDTTAPNLTMVLTKKAKSFLVDFSATDEVTASPAIHYTVNDGAVQGYGTALGFKLDQQTTLKAFSEDEMGNTSSLMTLQLPLEHLADGMISLIGGRKPIGKNRYDASGASETVMAKLKRNTAKTALITIQNEGKAMDTLRMKANASESADFTVNYRLNKKDVTAEVEAGTLTIPNLKPGKAATLKAIITAKKSAVKGETFQTKIETWSDSDANAIHDAVVYAVTVK